MVMVIQRYETGIQVHPEVIDLRGGSKQFWLNTHRKEVESYYIQHGREATLKRFNMHFDTLGRLFERRDRQIMQCKLSESDRWVLRVCNEGIRDIKKRLNELEARLDEAEPILQMGRGMVATLAQIHFEVNKKAAGKKPFELNSFSGKSGND